MTLATLAHNLADCLHRWIERRWLLLLALFSICYWTATGLYAAWRVMWFDELFTFYISNLSSPATIWRALAEGADLHPPAHYWLSYLSQAVLGPGEFALRLPGIACYWVLGLCVFCFIRRRCDSLHAAIGMLLLFSTGTQLSRLDARPYTIMLGCTALALLCWQLVPEKRWRRIALPGLALSVFISIMNHYYAVFLIPALVLGEWVRTRRLSKADVGVWVALACGTSALVFLLPLITPARSFAEHFARALQWGDLTQVYVDLLGGTVPLLLIALGLMSLEALWSGPEPPARSNRAPVLSAEEAAACLGLLAIPLPAFLLASTVTGAWAARYVGPLVIGFCILAAAALYTRSWRRHGSLVAAGLFVALAGWFLWQQTSLVRLSTGTSYVEGQRAVLDDLASKKGLPVAMPHASQYLPLVHYWPGPQASRLHYLTDRKASLRYRGTDMGGNALTRFARWVPLNVLPYARFLEGHPRFLVFGSIGWLLPKLLEDGAQVQLKGNADGLTVYEVVVPAG